MTATAPDPVADGRSVQHDYDVLGVRVRIVTDDPLVLATVDASYGRFRADRAGPPDPRDATINCRGREGSAPGWAVAGAWRPMATFATRDEAAIDVLDRLVDAILRGLTERGMVTVHAATVRVPAGILLIAARSGGGKTTLALGLAARGHGLLSDELAVFDPGGTVLPYPRAVHVRPETLGLIPALGFLADRPRHELGGGNEWAVESAELAEQLGLPPAEAGPLAGVVLVDGQPGEGSGAVTDASAATVALELTRGSWAASVAFGEVLERFASVVADVPCVRLDNGPLDVSLDAIEARFGAANASGSSAAAAGGMALGTVRRAVLERWRRDGVRSEIEATGGSMRPLIRPGDRLDVEFGALPAATGEVILFTRDDLVVAHRVVGRRPDGRWITKGDAEPFATEDVATTDVLGVVRAVRGPTDTLARTGGLGGSGSRVAARLSQASGRLERVARRRGPLLAIPSGLAARGGRVVLSRWTDGLAQAGQVESPKEGGDSA